MLRRFAAALAFLLWCSHAWAVPALTNIGTVGNGATNTPVTITGVTVTAGSTICAAFYSSPATPTVSDGVNTYSLIMNGSNQLWVYCAANASLSSGTITMTPATGGAIYAATVFYATGVSTSPFDASFTNSAALGSTITPSITSSAASAVPGEIVIGVVSPVATSTPTQSSGYTTPPNSFVGSVITIFGGNEILSTTSSASYSPTLSPAGASAIGIFALKPSGGGPACHKTLSLMGAGC